VRKVKKEGKEKLNLKNRKIAKVCHKGRHWNVGFTNAFLKILSVGTKFLTTCDVGFTFRFSSILITASILFTWEALLYCQLFGLTIGFIWLIKLVTTINHNSSRIYTAYNSLQYVLIALSLLFRCPKVTASNGGCSPSSVSPNCPHASATATLS
jgi:hypothetical protein